MKLRLLTFAVGTVLAAGMISACGDTTANMNSNSNRVTNMGTNNANVGAIVVNSNTTNANMANSNRWNANITREDYEKNRSEYEREKGSSTIGTGANDMWLWVKTRSSLMGTDDLRESTINVDVVNDVVTLRGTVETAAQKAAAEKVAKDIDGVKSVKNELKVSPDDSMTNMSSNSSSTSNTNRR